MVELKGQNIGISCHHAIFAVIYTGELEDGTVFERKGTNGEPFEFITLEGNLSYSCLVEMSNKFLIIDNLGTCFVYNFQNKLMRV